MLRQPKIIRYDKNNETILAVQGQILLVCLENTGLKKDGSAASNNNEARVRTSAYVNHGEDDWQEVSEEGKLTDFTVGANWEDLEWLAMKEFRKIAGLRGIS